MTENVKAIALMSGGLDSILAARLIMDQGIDVTGLSCKHPFHQGPPPGEKAMPEQAAEELGIELVRPDVSEKLINMVKAPAHGYGKHLNPCIDCRIIYLTEGERLMKERGAHFLVTGEVIGQRPMSQRRDAMNAIDRDSSLRGHIVRPLSAKLMDPTVPEKEGWVDRERLLDISGRGRGRQYELAEKYGLTKFGSPGGGCLLTMEDFARKMADLMEEKPDFDKSDVELLKRGRHYRLPSGTRLVVGRDDRDNRGIIDLARDDDVLVYSAGGPGPVALLRGSQDASEIETASRITARYMRKGGDSPQFRAERAGETIKELSASAMDVESVDALRI